MATAFIRPVEVRDYVDQHPIRDQYNPSECVCGWYCFTYAYCTHVFRRVDKKCGNAVSPTGKIVFCRTPAPTHILTQVKAGPDQACPDRNCVSTVLAEAANQIAAGEFDFELPPPNLPNTQNPPHQFGSAASRQSSVARSSPGPDRQPAAAAVGHSLAVPSVPRPSARVPAHPRPQSQPQPRNQTQTQPQRAQPQTQRAQPQTQRAQPQTQRAQPQTQRAQPQTQRPQMSQLQTQQPRTQTQTRPQQVMPEFEHYQPPQ